MAQRVIRGQMINRRADEEVALYRFFDSLERLLYIGITDEPMRRWYSHAERDWWPRVASYEVTWFNSRKEAATAEQRCIQDERPECNAVYNSIPYRGDRFPAVNLHALARSRFGDLPFTYRDMEDQLGVPYGTAVVYGPRLVQAGSFRDAGVRTNGAGRGRRMFVALPVGEASE